MHHLMRAGSCVDRPVQCPIDGWSMFRPLLSRMIEELACLSV
jgi:hypothetical protein